MQETNVNARHRPLCLKLRHGIDHFGRGVLKDMEKGEQDPRSTVAKIDRRKRQLVKLQDRIRLDRERKVNPQIGESLPDTRNAVANCFEITLTGWKRLHRFGIVDTKSRNERARPLLRGTYSQTSSYNNPVLLLRLTRRTQGTELQVPARERCPKRFTR